MVAAKSKKSSPTRCSNSRVGVSKGTTRESPTDEEEGAGGVKTGGV